MCGIGPKHVRFLCENQWNGGYGYRPSEIGDMSLDEIFMLLADEEILRSSRKLRSKSVNSSQAPAIDEDGYARGVAADGTPIRARIGGKSKVAMLREKAEQEEKVKQGSGRRRRRKR